MNEAVYWKYVWQIRLLYLLQIAYIFIFLIFYTHISMNVNQIRERSQQNYQECQVKEEKFVDLKAENKNEMTSDNHNDIRKEKHEAGVKVDINEKRQKRANPNIDEKITYRIDDWMVVFGDETLIPRTILQKSCGRIHKYCATKGKKLRGYLGLPGAIGAKGERGEKGRKGPTGDVGPQGLVGDAGEQGKPGKNGRCNCTFPDLFIQKISVPGPPIIKMIEKTVPIPIVVVKEVEVTKLVPFEPTPPGFSPPPGWMKTTGRPGNISLLTKTTLGTPEIETTFESTTTVINDSLLDFNDTFPDNFTLTNATESTIASTTLPPYTGPPTLGYKVQDCVLNAVGIPVLHAESQYGPVGSWMRDSNPFDEQIARRRWLTDDYASPVLYEYENERQLMNKKQDIKYYVNYLASGTGSIIYNGSYFYHRHGSDILIRYDLNSTEQSQHHLERIAYFDCARKHDNTFELCNDTDRDSWLYNKPHNYVDYAVDENGLWVVYTLSDSSHLAVDKIEPDFYTVSTWEITEANGTQFADTFIMCGVLYGLQSGTDRDSRINFAFDLYNNRSFPVDIPWYNPYRANSMLDYNPIDGRLYFYDNRRLLSVNVRRMDNFRGTSKSSNWQ